MTLEQWRGIFASSVANGGIYTGHQLPHNEWSWPRETWFEARKDFVRERLLQNFQKSIADHDFICRT